MRFSTVAPALFVGLALTAFLEPVKRADGCNADNCLRAVRASSRPIGVASADCSKYLVETVTPTTTSTVLTTSYTTTTPMATSSTVSTSISISTNVVPSTSTLSTSTVVTVSSASMTTTTTTTTVTSPLSAANAPVKRQVASSSFPSYASACSGYARYSSACSCIGVFAKTLTASGPVATQTITSTTAAPTSTSVTTSVAHSATTVTVTSGVTTVTTFTSTSTSTIYTATSTVTQQATATNYSFTLMIFYPANTQNTQFYLAASSVTSGKTSYNLFNSQSSPNGESTFVIDPSTGFVTYEGLQLLYGLGNYGSLVLTESPPSDPPLPCSIDSSDIFTCTDGGSPSTLALCSSELFISKGTGSPAPSNCNGSYQPVTLLAVST